MLKTQRNSDKIVDQSENTCMKKKPLPEGIHGDFPSGEVKGTAGIEVGRKHELKIRNIKAAGIRNHGQQEENEFCYDGKHFKI